MSHMQRQPQQALPRCSLARNSCSWCRTRASSPELLAGSPREATTASCLSTVMHGSVAPAQLALRAARCTAAMDCSASLHSAVGKAGARGVTKGRAAGFSSADVYIAGHHWADLVATRASKSLPAQRRLLPLSLALPR